LHIIPTGILKPSSVFAIDGDGDIDVLSASETDDKIVWYENDGKQVFTSHTITADANEPTSVFAIDVDGDVDVLSASNDDDKIAWYANDGDENFMPRIITTDANGATSVYAADVDGDGDIDVLSASQFDNKIAWYENSASLPVTSVNFIRPGSVPQQFILHNNYPNPFNPATTITYDLPEAANVVLKIYNVLGREVRTLLNSHQQPGVKSVVWDGRNAPGIKVGSGIFIYRLQAGDIVQTKKMILLK
ncbi:MAG: T9SS type A sorting domain-containing protein, partial [Caldithrix sp.]